MRFPIGVAISVCLFALSLHAQVTVIGAGDTTSVSPTASGRDDPRHKMDDFGSIAGTVTTMDGTPLHDCRIELHDATRGTINADAFTGPSGHFEFRNVSPGTYEVTALSGLEQAHEQVQVLHSETQVSLRLNIQNNDKSSGATVSVAEMRIPEKARQEWQKGQQALSKNKLQDARKHADRALEISPQYAQALTLRGILKLGADQSESGVVDLVQATKSDPNYAMGYIALGAGLNAERKFDDAVRALERGMALDPNAWQGWFELSKAEIARGDFSGALKHITRAAELNKDYPSIHLLMGHSLLGTHQYSRAVEEYELYLSQEPNSPNATNARAALGQARAYMTSAAR